MKRICAAILSLVVCGVTRAEEEPRIVTGVGSQTCGQFAADYRRSPSLAEGAFFTWAQGFMAGHNVALARAKQNPRNLQAKPIEEQKAYVRDYCDAHPLSLYLIAILDLYESMPVRKPIRNSN